MQLRQALFSPRLATLLLGGSALGLVAGIILFPDRAFQASLQGLHLWWKLVFPALLPFLIITELLRGLGVLHGLGGLFEPLMRALFRLPGIGGWVLSLGYTSGTPAGAAAVGELRRDGTLTRDEGERLLSASHVLSPVFIIGVVGTGFLQNPTSGLALAIIHYVSGFVLMLLHRFGIGLGAKSAVPAKQVLPDPPNGPARASWLAHSFHSMRRAKSRDGRTFGKLLGDAVIASIQQLFIIGGCIMMFSVMLQILSHLQFGTIAASIGALLGMNPTDASSLFTAMLTGLLEPNLGAFAMAQLAQPLSDTLPFSGQYALLSLFLAWGGLSTHAQVKSLTASTDLRFSRFLVSRVHHGGIAFVLTILSWTPLTSWLSREIEQPVFAGRPALSTGWFNDQSSLWSMVSPMLLQFGVILLLLLLLSIFTASLFKSKRRIG
ncbi:sporulation protein [Paenibacillus cremeus]|uniref:Sporulation protein n=1 Tax=Paenibacillus cremeus TaxID=2163881 RepID=A0A559K9H4_9BACL|nr:sporulation protein [Paenibacillus cremeus]TVY08774.1 sporulation protein [Paenibacillus cremeus]